MIKSFKAAPISETHEFGMTKTLNSPHMQKDDIISIHSQEINFFA